MSNRRSRARSSAGEVRFRHRIVQVSRRRRDRVIGQWLSDGWDVASETASGRRKVEIIFRRPKPNRRPWGRWAVRTGLFACIAALLLVVLAPVPSAKDPLAKVRADAARAFQALEAGDLVALDKELASNRGNVDFAYLFASRTTPRLLGDALATVAGENDKEPLKESVDAHAYDLTLTDLGGTLALATYGTGDRALPGSWTDDFVAATTTPEALYGGESDDSAERRADQDAANKQNLLLLLSRGYWSTEFLETVTDAYWHFDRAEGDDAWPGATGDGKYAPAPNGAYLTDGMVALTAALTANPAASKWAFTDFLPGTKKIDGSDYEVGKFTHYLLFEHDFPEVDGESIGMTAVLTALSSAIDATYGDAVPASSDARGALKDSLVLQELAKELQDEDSGCSFNPLDYLNCGKAAVKAVWNWMKDWGHTVLDILTLATFTPPPFTVIGAAIGVTAAAANATWYAIEGDYVMAGVSLAAAVPGLAFVKIAKGVKAARSVEKAAEKTDEIGAASRKLRGAQRIARDRELAEAGASQIKKSPSPAYPKEKVAEGDLARQIPGSTTQKSLSPRCRRNVCSGDRNVDIYDPKTGACIEVKQGIGTTNFKKHDQYEVVKDALLRKNKACKSVAWHFFPDAKGQVGPHGVLREALQENGIPYVMHLP